MNFDRLEVQAMIEFLSHVMPKDAKTGKNCVFVRVEGDKMIFTAGGAFSSKKAVLTAVSQMTTHEEKKLPEKFMIPRADIIAFKEMMKEHKADCKRLAKNDPEKMIVTITGDEMISHDGKVTFQQPSHQFKELEPLFQIKRDPVSNIPAMTKELKSVIEGFRGSKKVNITLTGDNGPIHFEQEDFEAILLPPVEKKKESDGQTSFETNQSKSKK